MAKFDSFVLCNLFCCKTNLKFMQVDICLNLQVRNMDCKLEI